MKPPINDWTWPLRTMPRIRTAGRFPLSDRDFTNRYCGHSIALHVHDYRGIIRIGEADRPLMPGDLTISPAWVPTSYHLPASGFHWCIHFTGEHQAGPRLTLPVHLRTGAADPYVRDRLARIAVLHDLSSGHEREHPMAVAASAALLELLCWLGSQSAISGTSAPMRADMAAEQVAELLRQDPGKEWTMAQLAQEVDVSPNYLAAKFRSRFAMTITRYRLHQRIALARMLLESTGLPIGEIGQRVGIADPHHFNKAFRKVVGVAPSQCRGGRKKPGG